MSKLLNNFIYILILNFHIANCNERSYFSEKAYKKYTEARVARIKLIKEQWPKNLKLDTKSLIDIVADFFIPFSPDDFEKNNKELINSAKNNNLIKIIELLENGCDINTVDYGGNTALMWASNNGHLEVAKFLIRNGATLDNKEGGMAGFTALILACRNGHLQIVKLLIDSGCNIDIIDNTNFTALSWAECNGHSEIVKLLKKQKNKCIIL